MARNSGSVAAFELANGWVRGGIIGAIVDRSWSNGANGVASVVADPSAVDDLVADLDLVFSVVSSVWNRAAKYALANQTGVVAWAKCDADRRIHTRDRLLAKIGVYVSAAAVVSVGDGVVCGCVSLV